VTVTREFHEAFDLDRPSTPPLLADEDLTRLRLRLIREEYEEVREELLALLKAKTPQETNEVFLRLLKELCDLRYVVEGCAVAFGLDIEAAYLEVHRSNMSKLGADGKPVYDRGKVMKGPDYSPADMTLVVPPIIDGDALPAVLE
jgi:predicted HAD superfamily Cof-like phosphohydrolase